MILLLTPVIFQMWISHYFLWWTDENYVVVDNDNDEEEGALFCSVKAGVEFTELNCPLNSYVSAAPQAL